VSTKLLPLQCSLASIWRKHRHHLTDWQSHHAVGSRGQRWHSQGNSYRL